MNANDIRQWSEDCSPDAASNDGLLIARAMMEVAAQLAELNQKLDSVIGRPWRSEQKAVRILGGAQ